MTFGPYLKTLVSDLVDRYRRWGFPTYSVALLLSLIHIALVALLFKLTALKSPLNIADSLLSTRFAFYSGGNPFSYAYLDLGRIAWFVLVGLFAICLFRLEKENAPPPHSLSWRAFTKTIRAEDFFFLIGVGVALGGVDYALAFLRTYLPLFVIAYTLRWRLLPRGAGWTFKQGLGVLAGLWIVETLSYDLTWVIQRLVFFPPQVLLASKLGTAGALLVFQSLLAIPLLAFFFVAYASAMLSPLVSHLPPDDGHIDLNIA